MSSRPLARVLGSTTALLAGLGVAIGSGIFRTPAIVARELPSPAWIIAIWVFGGVFALASSLVSAELATRFPKAGGEYVYLREAYGEFAAFFFGWGYTIFIAGGGAATIAAAFGEACAELFNLGDALEPLLAVGGVVLVASVNALGLRVGAGFQNALAVLKIAAVAGVAILAFVVEENEEPVRVASGLAFEGSLLSALLVSLPPVLWAYEGTTDATKLAEEVKHPERAMPRALLGSALAIALLYVVANVAFLSALSLGEMASSRFVANDVLERAFGAVGRRAITAVSVLAFLGALGSTMLVTVRVPFALARDGLSFRSLARMSKRQTPIAALIVTATIAAVFAASRDFASMLGIYFVAATVLYGMAYGSLLVFRTRERRGSATATPAVFRCPFGPVLPIALIAIQIAMAARIVATEPMDGVETLGLFAAVAIAYFVWKRRS